MSVQELSSTAKVQDSTFKFHDQMALFDGQWSAASDPQSKLISSILTGKDRRHSYSGLSSTLLVEPFSFYDTVSTVHMERFKVHGSNFKFMLLNSMAQEQRDTYKLNGSRPTVKVY